MRKLSNTNRDTPSTSKYYNNSYRKYLLNVSPKAGSIRRIYYRTTIKKDLSNIRTELRTLNCKTIPDVIIHSPSEINYQYADKKVIYYFGNTEDFYGFKKDSESQNQAIFLLKIMRKFGYMELKYGKRRFRK
jgi:hypothetical protein